MADPTARTGMLVRPALALLLLALAASAQDAPPAGPSLVLVTFSSLRAAELEDGVTPNLVALRDASTDFRRHAAGTDDSLVGVLSAMYGLAPIEILTGDGVGGARSLGHRLRDRALPFAAHPHYRRFDGRSAHLAFEEEFGFERRLWEYGRDETKLVAAAEQGLRAAEGGRFAAWFHLELGDDANRRRRLERADGTLARLLGAFEGARDRDDLVVAVAGVSLPRGDDDLVADSPFFLRLPGRPPRVVDHPSRGIDVLPTLLAALGKGVSGLEGRDLLADAAPGSPAIRDGLALDAEARDWHRIVLADAAGRRLERVPSARSPVPGDADPALVAALDAFGASWLAPREPGLARSGSLRLGRAAWLARRAAPAAAAALVDAIRADPRRALALALANDIPLPSEALAEIAIDGDPSLVALRRAALLRAGAAGVAPTLGPEERERLLETGDLGAFVRAIGRGGHPSGAETLRELTIALEGLDASRRRALAPVLGELALARHRLGDVAALPELRRRLLDPATGAARDELLEAFLAVGGDERPVVLGLLLRFGRLEPASARRVLDALRDLGATGEAESVAAVLEDPDPASAAAAAALLADWGAAAGLEILRRLARDEREGPRGMLALARVPGLLGSRLLAGRRYGVDGPEVAAGPTLVEIDLGDDPTGLVAVVLAPGSDAEASSLAKLAADDVYVGEPGHWARAEPAVGSRDASSGSAASSPGSPDWGCGVSASRRAARLRSAVDASRRFRLLPEAASTARLLASFGPEEARRPVRLRDGADAARLAWREREPDAVRPRALRVIVSNAAGRRFEQDVAIGGAEGDREIRWPRSWRPEEIRVETPPGEEGARPEILIYAPRR
ncbi:MAG: hypothetical protein R3F20_19490 [Planctomycetota bacterium]